MERPLLEEAENKEESLKKRLWSEAKKIWIVAAPAILLRLSTFGVNLVSQAFIGHISSTQLAAFALVFGMLFRFLNAIMAGMSSGFGTLCGQAYGARQYEKLGLYLQQSWMVLLSVAVILCPVLVFAGPVLKALGQDEELVEMAQPIAYWFVPLLLTYAIYSGCNVFLQSQSKVFVISCASAVTLALHVFLSWLLTMRFEFGMTGAMTSTALAFLIPNATQLVYIRWGPFRETWRGFSRLAFKDLGQTIKIAVSSSLMLCLELWYNSALILLAGNMVDAEVSVDALTICLNITGGVMMISIGFAAASTVRVSNELGRKSTKAAKFAMWTLLSMSIFMALVFLVLLLIFRYKLAYLFTKNEDVAAAVARLSPLLACTLLINSIQPVLSGAAVGAGRQSRVMYLNLGSYYLIGIPLAIIFGFVLNWQVQGVWMGMIIGSTVQVATLIIMTLLTNWDEQVSLAQKRVNRPLS